MNNNDKQLQGQPQVLKDVQHTGSTTLSSSIPLSASTSQQQQAFSAPILQPLPQSEQQERQKRQTKKCRGNRKRQRFVAKLKKRGLNKEEIDKLLDTYHNVTQSENDEQSTTTTTTTTTISDMDIELLIPEHDVVSEIYYETFRIGNSCHLFPFITTDNT